VTFTACSALFLLLRGGEELALSLRTLSLEVLFFFGCFAIATGCKYAHH
jgi:hypothetical protein